jgi:HEAT repeat protein
VAVAALEALAARKKAVALDTLVAYTDHRNPKVRASAVAALAAIDDKRADKHILAALHDGHVTVRAAATSAVASRKLKAGVEPLMVLLVKGDEATAPALAALADPALAKDVAETIGKAPDAVVARCLGAILARPDFKPDTARVEVVRALGQIDAQEALEQLTSYVSSVPKNPPRQSRKEAEQLVEMKLGGGGK